MRGLIVSFVLAATVWSPAVLADNRMPSGTFTCALLMARTLTGTNSDEFVPSVLGTFTLDGVGGYTRQGMSGSVAVESGVLKFTSGEMTGIVGILKNDPRGRSYLHIDGEVSSPPAGDPKPADFVCYKQ